MAKLTDAQKRRKYCPGCRDEFYYAGQNKIGVSKCWHLSDSQVKWKAIFLSVDSKNPTRVRTLDCFTPLRELQKGTDND